MKTTKRRLIRKFKNLGIPFRLRVFLADKLKKGDISVVDMFCGKDIDGVRISKTVKAGKQGTLVKYVVYAKTNSGKFVPVYTVDTIDD